MFHLQVVSDQEKSQIQLKFSQKLVTLKSIKTFSIEAPSMHSFAEKFSRNLKICADDAFYGDCIQSTTDPLSFKIKADLETFEEFWLPCIIGILDCLEDLYQYSYSEDP